MSSRAQALAHSGDEAILVSPEREQQTAKFHVEQLAREHARMVFRIAYSAVRNQQDAEDATQEVFLRVLRYAHRLPHIDDTKSWVAQIAWRVSVEWRKKKSLEPVEDAIEVLGQLRALGPSVEEIASGSQMQQYLQSMISGLPRKLREPLLLSMVEELNSAEIGALLEIPEGTVRRRLMHARQMLKEKLTAILETK